MTAPWTPRERALREALGYCAHYLHAIRKAIPDPIYVDTLGDWCATHPSEEHLEFSLHDTEASVSAALADQPPPDPRDEALRLAEQCLSNIKDDLIRSINQTTLCHHWPINDREREAAALCCGEGYGNMMSILSTQWHLSVGGGAFVVGECVTTAQNQVKDIEAALAAIAAAKGGG